MSSGGRWHSWSATSPMWVSGLVLIAIGIGLVWAGVRSHGR